MARQMVIAGMLAAAVWSGGYQTLASQTARQSAPALNGIVTSEAEGPMEGVLVSAKPVAGTIAVTVVTDRQGRYVFRISYRLKPGQYELRTRATGYHLIQRGVVWAARARHPRSICSFRSPRIFRRNSRMPNGLRKLPAMMAQKKSISGCVHCHSWMSSLNEIRCQKVCQRLEPDGQPREWSSFSSRSMRWRVQWYAKDWGPYAEQGAVSGLSGPMMRGT